MAHQRQTIREAAVTLLTGLTTTGTTVYDSRYYPHETLPALAVLFPAEEVISDPMRAGSGGEVRQLVMVVEGEARAVAGVEDTLDDIASEVEAAIDGSRTITATVKDARYEGMEVEYSNDQQQPIGRISLTYALIYQV